MHDDKGFGSYRDDGPLIDPGLIEKPSLCVICRKDDELREEILCTPTRADQEGQEVFQCEAFEPRR